MGDDLLPPVEKKRVRSDQQRARPTLGDRTECHVDLVHRGRTKYRELHTQASGALFTDWSSTAVSELTGLISNAAVEG